MPDWFRGVSGFIVRHRQEQRNYTCTFRALWNEDKVMQLVREERLTIVIQRIVFDELLERRCIGQ